MNTEIDLESKQVHANKSQAINKETANSIQFEYILIS